MPCRHWFVGVNKKLQEVKVEKRRSTKKGRIEGNVVNDRRGVVIVAFILPFYYGYYLTGVFPPLSNQNSSIPWKCATLERLLNFEYEEGNREERGNNL